jgi:hypothetical protein
MSVQFRIKTAAVAVAATALLGSGTVLAAAPAYAHGGSPFSGRTEGGSLEVKSGDIVACEAVGKETVVEPNGTFHHTGGPGSSFTTAHGAEFEVLANLALEVSFRGASATVRCGSDLVPATTAFVPRETLSGEGGSVTGVNTVTTAAGGALIATGLAGAGLALRRRRATVKA